MREARSSVADGDGFGERVEPFLAEDSIDSRATGHASVVIGYNHDVPHRGRMYHVQTEDSGRGRGHIFTHVFHSGAIVSSARVDYGEAATALDVIGLLRSSHKTMMRRLVQGLLDEVIERCLGERPGAPVLTVVAGDGRPTVGRYDPSHDQGKKLQDLIEALDMDNINQTLENLRNNVAGTLGVALVDYESGMCLGASGTGINLEIAAAGNMDVMKAKARVMRDLGIEGGIEDILITLDSQYHIIRPIGTSLFIYLAMDRKQGNLALARHKLAAAASEVKL